MTARAATDRMAAGLPLGRRDRARLAERIAALRPLPAAGPGGRRGSRLRLPAVVGRWLDPLLGIDRDVASDESISVLRPLLGGAAAALVVQLCLGKLLGLSVTLAMLAAVPAALVAARAVVGGRRDATRQLMEDQFALALGVIIRCVRAGLPVNEGMRAVAAELAMPTGPEFRRCVDQIQLGVGFDAALTALAGRCALADYRFFAVAVALQRQTGGNLAETLDNLSETIRKRRAVRLRAQALTSETRATVMVLALLPVVVGGILMLVSPDYVMQLFTTESGRRLLGIAMLTQAFGLAVIRIISRRSLS